MEKNNYMELFHQMILIRLVEEHAKQNVFLTVLGFGMDNHNDAMLEQISNKGNGNYAFIDTDAEARKVLVEQMTGSLMTTSFPARAINSRFCKGNSLDTPVYSMCFASSISFRSYRNSPALSSL